MSVEPIGFARFAKNGYEVSSRGDQRFSALYARMADGRTLEQHYQCDTKGFDPGGTNWRLGKGKPPLRAGVDLWSEYLELWRQWARANPALVEELRAAAAGKVLTDMFATSPVNQARALSQILAETAPTDADGDAERAATENSPAGKAVDDTSFDRPTSMPSMRMEGG